MTDAARRWTPARGTPPIVQLRGITKTFPGVVANEAVDVEVMPGEIHALLGENGAGKSTLMNVLTGIYQPDEGEIVIDGYAQTFASPVAAIAAGIGMVHQHFKLVGAFTVAENVHLGWSETPFRASARQLEARTAVLARTCNLAVRPGARVSELSTGEQQRVEILRVLSRKARVLILDEPTAVLTPPEAQELFRALRTFAADGNAVIFISHKLEEVLEISDRISVLRGGRKVATQFAADCTARSLARLMVGRDIVVADMRRRAANVVPMSATPVVSLAGVSVHDITGKALLGNIDLDVMAGEVVGIAGVAGNGQRELAQVLAGIRPVSAGRIAIDGTDVTHADAATFAAMGVGHIPEDRLTSGLAPALSVTANAVLREYKAPPVTSGGFYRPGRAATVAREIAAAAGVTVPDGNMPVRNLSGGNQQRLVARREIRIADRVLIAAYPSRGLDVGAINAVLRAITELRDAGAGIVLISEDLDELLNLADRIAVIYEGRIMGIVAREDIDIDEVGLLMGGRQRQLAVA